MLAWFVLCLTGIVGNVANWAHGGGLAAGAVLGYLAFTIQQMRRHRAARNSKMLDAARQARTSLVDASSRRFHASAPHPEDSTMPRTRVFGLALLTAFTLVAALAPPSGR